MKKLSSNKYLTLFSLYIAQSVPMTFFSTVMPVIMRQNHFSLTTIGLLQLVKLPWILKFLWAPMIDKSSKNTKDFKKWIFSSELVYAFFITSIAFLKLDLNFSLIIVFLVMAFIASATQDIATDAFAILILKKQERSLGNSMQSGGSFLGTLIGSGILLIIYSKFGWKYLIFGLAIFVLMALVPLFFYNNEKQKIVDAKSKISFKDIYLFFRQKGILKHVILLFFFYSGIVGILTMSKPWLVDLGFRMSQIGVYSGIYGALGGVISALLAGFIIKKIGRKIAIILFSAISVLVTSYFFYLTFIPQNSLFIIIGLVALWAAYGANSVAIFTIAMDSVRKGREGTDFTIQIVLTHLGSLIIAIISGKIAHNFNYRGLFLLEIILSALIFITIPFLYTFKLQKNEN